ncbi:MAG: hypothetical protein EPO40_34615 [Myxococcaceae bacterium]|nr:MAG: hypothetical protein EPO40_34615 [Myxococcaceae bacterium]
MSRRRAVVILCAALLAGCGDEVMTEGDAQVTQDAIVDDRGGQDAPFVDGALEDRAALPDAVVPDAGARDGALTDAAVADDRPEIDAGADVPRLDVPGVDAGAADVPAARDVADAGDSRASTDVPAIDVPRDVPAMDVPRDVPAMDVLAADVPAMDVPRDVPAADMPAADVPRDVPAADVPRDVPVDVSSCTGAGPVVTPAAPTSGQEIETCTTGGLPVFFDFTASVTASSPVRSVGARWITPDGLEAPPAASLSSAPYVFRRQVGGPSAGAPALSVFGIRGTWRVEFTAVDACGRSTTASQTFSLIFTSRRCPNP